MDHITNNNWALSVGVFLPLVGVAVMMFIPRAEEQLHKAVALVTAAATLGVGIWTVAHFSIDRAKDLQFYVDHSWIDVINSRYIMGLDGISVPLYLLSMIITLLVMIYSWDHIPEPGNPKAFLILMLVLQVPDMPAYHALVQRLFTQDANCLLYTSPSPRD